MALIPRAGAEVFRYGRFEHSLKAAETYEHPLQDVEVMVEFTGPGGSLAEVPAFWDGDQDWKVRFSPDLTGPWSFRTRCSNTKDRGLHRQGGTFRVDEYTGENRLLLSGAPRVPPGHRHFELEDGDPWFWLACTGWNSALKSTDEEWAQYIADRARRKFTAIQFVMTQWRAAMEDEAGDVAFTGTERIGINPRFFRRMDKKFDSLNEAGLVAAPVLLWALTSQDNESPGESLPDSQAALLAGYMVARYGAHHVIWILGGDGDYRGEKAQRWKSIGRAVFPPGRPRRPVSLHPRGMQDPWPGLKDEPWIDFFLYQSGHGGNSEKWKWNATAGPAVGWKLDPARPVIDAEPNYEGHTSYHDKQVITEIQVRRAAYYSLLSAPPAGITYGAHGIWPWNRELATPLNHPNAGLAEAWHECLGYPGARQMTVLMEFFSSLEWWKLRPDRSLLAEDEQGPDFVSYPMPARSEDGRFAVIYLPDNPKGKLDISGFSSPVDATWVDPRTGERTAAGGWQPESSVEWTTPSEGDWLLLLALE